MQPSEKSRGPWIFLGIVVLLYGAVLVFDPQLIKPAIKFSLDIFLKIIPVFILIYVMMVIVNAFISPSWVSRMAGRSAGAKRWVIAIVGGILSTGPIYMWYPLLKQLREKGVSYGFMASFLYNRAIKLPLLPLIIYYFSWRFTVVLTLVMVAASLLQGILLEKIMDNNLTETL
ncbi:hypothetical protein JXA05_02250 [Candidatus Peregrinibacteria bacterium]|nr:hypothetical protein [Candidatus Peregrinibacteria bacterium]